MGLDKPESGSVIVYFEKSLASSVSACTSSLLKTIVEQIVDMRKDRRGSDKMRAPD